MKEKIISKIEREHELYILDVLSTSKSNIVALSSCIELRKSISRKLREYVKGINEEKSPELLKALLYSDNLTEDAYRFVTDHDDISTEESFKLWTKRMKSKIKK